MVTCKEVQNSMEQFDKEILSLKDEENFCSHVHNCPDCREEMELYYIISYGLLDDNENTVIDERYAEYYNSLDFKGLVDAKLENSQDKCMFFRNWTRFNQMRYLFVMGAMGLTFLAGIIILFF